MDYSFPSLEVVRPFATPLGLDFQHLIATCSALQAATPTAIAEARVSGKWEGPVRPADALVRLIEGKNGWAASVAILGGNFNPEAARYASDNNP